MIKDSIHFQHIDILQTKGEQLGTMGARSDSSIKDGVKSLL